MTTNDAAKAVEAKAVVTYQIDGAPVFFGIAEHLTADGWIGIRQPHEGGRLDEAPVARVEFDPT
jgi:hypothetical protein